MDLNRTMELRNRFPFVQCAIEVDNGWYGLLKDLFLKIEKALINSPEDTGFKIIGVTKKMGCLRIYTANTNPYIEHLVIEAERGSEQICEECGSQGILCYGHGVYKVLCPKHRILGGFRVVKK